MTTLLHGSSGKMKRLYPGRQRTRDHNGYLAVFFPDLVDFPFLDLLLLLFPLLPLLLEDLLEPPALPSPRQKKQ